MCNAGNTLVSPSERILNGVEVVPQSWEFIALIETKTIVETETEISTSTGTCGGVVLNEEWILKGIQKSISCHLSEFYHLKFYFV